MKNKLIKHVLEQFDWEKTHKAMVALEWEWRGEGVPSISQLQSRAVELLNFACTEAKTYRTTAPDYVGPFTVGTGGFEAHAWLTDDGKIEGVRLSFMVASWDEWR